MAALALNCEIPNRTKWDRKNYYYPDLPKGYQISQYDMPLSQKGWLEIEVGENKKRVGIIRAHLEEDAGKSMHDESGKGGDTRVDLNRSGTPLLEIVSEPDLTSPEEARAYLEELRLLLRTIGASDCEMQEGSLRCDANVNVHVLLPGGGTSATPIVEIKNLNSFRSVERAVRYEAERQYEQFRKDGKKIGEVAKATAGWDDERGVTVVQRRKEEAADYRYFPEPDLGEVVVDQAMQQKARVAMGELPAAARNRLQEAFSLSAYDSRVITAQGRPFIRYFEELAAGSGDSKAASNWTTNAVMAWLNEHHQEIDAFPIRPDRLGGLIREIQKTGLNMQRAREVFAHMLQHGSTAPDACKSLGFVVMGDPAQIAEIVRRAIAANPKAVADFKKGKVKAADSIKGFVMRETKGMARTELVQEVVMAELEAAPNPG
jgi:aspartyl-tRNA(Asn)/glutamyl-tRNA(Gln) amidotransferase subunit B